MTGRERIEGMNCKHCGNPLRIEWRDEYIAKPLGTYSIAGAQNKVVAHTVQWPWAVCDTCKLESKGKR